MVECSCNKGFPIIAVLRPHEASCFVASHNCSHCGAHLFDSRLVPGEKVIATTTVVSDDGQFTIPKGRVLRITGFMERPALPVGLAFCGMLAAGAFRPQGFAAVWNLEKIFDI